MYFPPTQDTMCLTVDDQLKHLSRESNQMKTNEIIETSWTANFAGYSAENNTKTQHSDNRDDCGIKGNENSIKRDESGTIDYAYYAARARRIRSETLFSFFKAFV